jgi:hypothetical protein
VRRAALAVTLAIALTAAVPAAAVTARTTLVAIEQQVMCVTCGIPLQEADSPAAQQEKAYIQQLINDGDTAASTSPSISSQSPPCWRRLASSRCCCRAGAETAAPRQPPRAPMHSAKPTARAWTRTSPASSADHI